jgi:hypothetical protein
MFEHNHSHEEAASPSADLGGSEVGRGHLGRVPVEFAGGNTAIQDPNELRP